MMPKEDILRLFPTEMHEHLKNKSQVQLAMYVKDLTTGTSASRLFETLADTASGAPTQCVPAWRARKASCSDPGPESYLEACVPLSPITCSCR